MIEIQNNKILLDGKELQFDNKIIEAAEYEGKVVIVFETDEDGGYDNVFCYTQDLQLLWRIKPAPVAIGGTARSPYVGNNFKRYSSIIFILDILIYALLAIECCERVCVFCESIIINSEWSSIGDKFSDVGNAIKNFLTGVEDSIEGTVKRLLTLVADLGILYVYSECTQTVSGYVPEVLDQEVEKIKQKYEPLFKDPVNTIGGIGQSICDTADEKGVAYSSGYIVTEVVTALLADKGLDKLKNVAKTGKTADNVADIAEGAGKAA